jgi:AcrR family transcriptional regulator
MPRPPLARAPLRQAALRLFVEQGFHATGIRDIARAAGVSEAALYRHWSGKDELALDLFTEHLGEVTTLLDLAIGSRPPAQAVAAATRACLDLYDREPLVFRFVLMVEHDLARRLPADRRMPQDVIADLARAAAAAGGVKEDPGRLSAFLIGLFLQTASYALYGRLPGPLASHADAVAAAALRVLGLPPERT